MTDLILITDHPDDPSLVLIKVPQSMNSRMAGFRAAVLNRQLHAYVLAADSVESFLNFARYTNLAVTDGRGAKAEIHNGPRPQPQECRHCGQGGSLEHPPKRCPACGERWDPMTPKDIAFADPLTMTDCTACGHSNPHHFAYCRDCGEPLTYLPPAMPSPAFVQQRARGGDPVAIGDLLPDLAIGNVLSRETWLNYRRFWRSIPFNVARYRPEIERWVEAGRPADWAAWLRSAGRSTAQEAAAPGSESASKPSTSSEASGASTAHDFAEWDETLPDEDES